MYLPKINKKTLQLSYKETINHIKNILYPWVKINPYLNKIIEIILNKKYINMYDVNDVFKSFININDKHIIASKQYTHTVSQLKLLLVTIIDIKIQINNNQYKCTYLNIPPNNSYFIKDAIYHRATIFIDNAFNHYPYMTNILWENLLKCSKSQMKSIKLYLSKGNYDPKYIDLPIDKLINKSNIFIHIWDDFIYDLSLILENQSLSSL